MVVLDDKEARVVADALEVEHVGTAGILLEAFMRGVFDYDELEEAVRDLGSVMWLAPDVITEILKRAREMKK